MQSIFDLWGIWFKPRPRTKEQLIDAALRKTAFERANQQPDVEPIAFEVTQEEFVMLMKDNLIDFVYADIKPKTTIPTLMGHIVSVRK